MNDEQKSSIDGLSKAVDELYYAKNGPFDRKIRRMSYNELATELPKYKENSIPFLLIQKMMEGKKSPLVLPSYLTQVFAGLTVVAVAFIFPLVMNSVSAPALVKEQSPNTGNPVHRNLDRKTSAGHDR